MSNLDKVTPKSLTRAAIRLKAHPVNRRQEKDIHLTINSKVDLPDEFKLVVLISLVATLAWMMLTVYVGSFSQPRIIIIDSQSGYLQK